MDDEAQGAEKRRVSAGFGRWALIPVRDRGSFTPARTA
jgi:hypothetical protein